MIPVMVGDQLFGIGFRHTKLTMIDVKRGDKIVKCPEPKRQRRETQCSLIQIDKQQDGNVTGRFEVASGIASCSPLDNFCKETGRTIALNKALKAARQSGHPLFTAHTPEAGQKLIEVEETLLAGYIMRPRGDHNAKRESEASGVAGKDNS